MNGHGCRKKARKQRNIIVIYNYWVIIVQTSDAFFIEVLTTSFKIPTTFR